jgi:hypothetical protein
MTITATDVRRCLDELEAKGGVRCSQADTVHRDVDVPPEAPLQHRLMEPSLSSVTVHHKEGSVMTSAKGT